MGSKTVSQVTKDLCWNTALLEAEFTYYSLSRAIRRSVNCVRMVVKGWETEGRVQRLGIGAKGCIRLRLIDPATKLALYVPRIPGREGETVHGNMWNAMRGLKVFTPMDIAAHAATERTKVSEDTARGYCAALLLSEHLRIKDKAIPGRRDAVYQLVQNTGPKAPRELQVNAIWDPNRAEYMHIAGAEQ